MKELTPDVTQSEIQRRLKIAASRITHNHSLAPKGSPENRAWWAWVQMRQRCFNPKSQAYKWYGARGISVCPEWVESYVQFFADMGGPTSGKSLDRINNDGNHEVGNVRWASRTEQARNQRSNRMIKINGEEKMLIDWINASGLKNSTVRNRISRNGGVVDGNTFTALSEYRKNLKSKALLEAQTA